jgi:hypothetical protein
MRPSPMVAPTSMRLHGDSGPPILAVESDARVAGVVASKRREAKGRALWQCPRVSSPTTTCPTTTTSSVFCTRLSINDTLHKDMMETFRIGPS